MSVLDAKPAEVGEAVNAARLQAWMDEQGLGHGPLEDLISLGGGTQNTASGIFSTVVGGSTNTAFIPMAREKIDT